MESVLVASPYLKDSHDFQQQPPSASSSNHFDGSHPSSPYEGFAFEPDFPQENHHFPHTPSYNGSYQNSPYSVISDLPYENPDAPDFSLFDNRSAAGGEEYDPSEYDIPNGPSLLTFDESFMPNVDVVDVSVSITPPFDQPSPTGYDHSSPASSAGEDGRHSRASSTSSYMHPNSPPLDFAHNFESLHFDSPAWGPSNLPVDRPSPPAQKPQSPPQLVIPESPAMTANEEPPTINAPEGDGMLNGPQLHIVPATPVSGGGGVAQSVPFLQQGGSQDPSNTWDQTQQHLSSTANQSMAPATQYTDQSQNYYTGSNPSSPGMSFANPNVSEPAPAAKQSRHQFLVPQIPVARSRSLSDTSLRPPIWNTAPMAAASGSAIVDTVNMNDVLPGPGSTSPSPSPIPGQRHPSSAGPHQTSFNNNLAPLSYPFGHPSTMSRTPNMSNDYLTPDVGAVDLRRSKSDNGRSLYGHRQSRSEDIRYSPSLASTTANNFPPPGQMSREYLGYNSTRQFLHPTQAVIPSIAAHGGHRRSSSTSRERPMGWNSAASSARASPYPSPSASPRPGYGPLPGGDYGMAQLGMGHDGMGLGIQQDDGSFVNVAGPGQPEHKIAVSR